MSWPVTLTSQAPSRPSKALKIIGISHDEAECLGLLLSHHRHIGSLSVFSHLLFGLALFALSWFCPSQISAWYTWSASNPLLVKLPKPRCTAHLHSFVPLFSHLWNQLPQSIQSHSSHQGFKIIVHHYSKKEEWSFSPEVVVNTKQNGGDYLR